MEGEGKEGVEVKKKRNEKKGNREAFRGLLYIRGEQTSKLLPRCNDARVKEFFGMSRKPV